jgi:hypothetical protein
LKKTEEPPVVFAQLSLSVQRAMILHGEVGDVIVYRGGREGTRVFEILRVEKNLPEGEIYFKLRPI